MGILLISIIIFILIFASGYVGLHVQKRLADDHKTGESTRCRRAGFGAGHPAAGAGPRHADRRQFRLLSRPRRPIWRASPPRSCGSIRPLRNTDRRPSPLRDKIKAGIVKGYETFWGGGDVDPKALTVEVPLANAQAISDFLATLQPKTDVQKRLWRPPTNITSMVEQSRLLMSLQVASGPVSGVLIAILVFWTLRYSSALACCRA